MTFLGLTTHFVFITVSFGLLLVRGIHSAEKSVKHGTSTAWFPSGPPPTKLPTEAPEALKKVLPLVSFDCKGKTGYFPDAKFNCEVFHYCKPDGTRNTFLCPPHSLFNQLSMVCEETSPLNSKICKEGSIGTKKEKIKEAKKTYKSNAKFTSKKKYGEDFSKQHRIKPVPALNNTRSNFENTKSFEELLSYGHQKPTFYYEDGFSYDGDLVKLPKSTVKSVKTAPTASTTRKTSVTISGQPNNSKFSKLESISIDREILQPSESIQDDVSVEYDAIEGRKVRQHKRVGRVLNVGEAPRLSHKGKRQTHSHVSARSPTENPPEDSTRSPTSSSTARSTTLPSLFSADRSKARDFRKRRRNLNRRRKFQKTNETTTEAIEILDTTTTTQSTLTTKEDSREASKFDYSRRRINSTRKNPYKKENSQSWLGLSKSGQVEPYTLPPLPVPEDDQQETTTNTIGNGEPVAQLKKKFPEKGGRTRNPWYKTTPIPVDDLIEIKFGEKISELYHQHYHTNTKPESNPTEQKEVQEFKQKSFVSKELVHDEYDKYLPQDTSSYDDKNGKGKYRKDKQISDIDDVYHLFHSDNKKHQPTKIEDLFPPPRAEPREQKSLQQHETQQLYSSVEKSVTSSEERTTESPFKTTKAYERRYRTKSSRQQGEGQRWRLNKDRKRMKGRKIEVGSTFSLHTESPESDSQVLLQIPTTTQSPVTISALSRKELPKTTTLAHQHLLKLMNEFFAMSSTTTKDLAGKASETIEDTVTPNSRVSDDDIVLGSESTTDEVEELPPEVLEVVDMLAGQSDEDKKEYKSDSSHEIIKISGPLTNDHLKQILSDDVFEAIPRPPKRKKETVKKIVFVPQEEKDDFKDESENIAKFTSLKLQPLLKQMASVIPVTQNPPRHRQPAVLTAKKIPVRVIYKDQLSEANAQRKLPKSNLKIIRSQLPNPSLQIIQKGRITPTRTYSQPHPKNSQRLLHSRQALVLQPHSLYPPHPPPLPKKSLPFKIGFPFASGNRPISNLRYASHRRKRSVLNRDRRQIRPNPRFFPFPRPVFPTFNPKFVPTFPPFRNMFPPNGMNSASSNVNPFTFPRFEAPKPNIGVPPMYKPSNSPPAPVRHITQHGDQTVIVEEVPVPIHVEVPDPNFLRPVHSGNEPKNHLNPYSNNQFRSPSPPSIQSPPLLQGFQGRFPMTNNYPPYGMPSNAQPPVLNYQPSVQFSQPLPPSITDQQGQVFSLGVTNTPFAPVKPSPGRIPNGPQGITGKPPLRPFQHFDVHANNYPNFPYFQGAFTTPLTIEQVPGRLMYSGYKPPKTTEEAKIPRTTSLPHQKVTNHADQSSRRPQPRPKPTQAYYSPRNPVQEQRMNYYAPNVGFNVPPKPNLEGVPREHSYLNQPRPNLNNVSPSHTEEPPPRRRRPNRKRRPRPRMTTTTPAVHISKDISPTPIPPEQIPPPPATYTSIPLNSAIPNSLQSAQESAKIVETSSHYPPAGYYGKDQLGQFFDSSSKSYNKGSTPKPYEHNNLAESTSSAETEESISSVSSEDPDQPAFGTRLRSKPRGSGRRRKIQPVQAPTERTETRTRPNSIPNEIQNKNKRIPATSSNRSARNREKNENINNQRRQRVLQHRSRNAAKREPEIRHFNNPNGFYSVPSGLQDLVAPERPSQSNGRTTDMFGIPHPSMDQNAYSIRPEGNAGDFNSNFFSVPAEVAKQQQSPLLSMNIKPIPESAREFFEEAAKESSKIKENSEKKEEAEQNESKTPTEETKPQRNPAVRKLKKPKRKNRYNSRNEEKQSTEGNSDKPQTIQEQRNALSKERTTTPATTTSEPRPAYIHTTSNTSPQNDIKEQTPVFKQRTPLLPKTLPDLSKSLLDGKIDIKKLNATISTSVSVTAFPHQPNNTSSEENSNKKVFSSQNGGLAVVRSNPRKRKPKQRQSTFPEDEDSKTKYDIAASVLDIIKATTETEKNGAGFYSTRFDKSQSSSPKSSTT
ncbi:U-scoloptoxin(01)-Er1a like protein [Argiope bruennichi]|uniref:U-scoloptoxin(01)-Er1a like protein n=1 Tax=Argiope bruennichi TaxID=94029 RepID=A0A8T0EXY1_ARGBR|nr:U-scoloptoxin(01)-Er1a like protein [Argiope bruennichi]